MSEAKHSLIVRETEAADIKEITEIFAYNVENSFASWDYEPPDETEIRQRWETIVAQGYPHFVAIWADEVVGYSYASTYRPRPGYRFTVENSIYVRQDMQRQGIARALLLKIIEACTERGYRQMIAIIGDNSNVPSIKLHEELGFHHVGLLRNIGWKKEQWLDSVVMQRTLGEGGETPPPPDM